MSEITHWNFRVLQEEGSTDGEFSLIEVYYAKDEIFGHAAVDNLLSGWAEAEDLKGTVEYLSQAFTRPVLKLVDGKLVDA